MLVPPAYLALTLVALDAAPHPPVRAAAADTDDRARADPGVGDRLDAGGRRALRAAAAARAGRSCVFLGTFLVAILLGMVSHVPGGVGVFEGLMVLLLRPYLTSGELLPSLVVFRAVYYLAAARGRAGRARRRRGLAAAREPMARATATLGRLTEELDPARPGRAHVRGRPRPAALRRHARGRGPTGHARRASCRSASSRPRTSSAASPARHC